MYSNTNNINYNDFRTICRACLSNCDLKPIKQENFVTEVLHNLTGVRFESNDELPQQICGNCFEKIHDIHEFSLRCKLTHSSLLKCLNNYKNVRLKQENVKIEATKIPVKVKEEITIEEHNIEFISVNHYFDETNSTNLNLKQELIEETNNEFEEDLIPETSLQDEIISDIKTISDSESLPSDAEDTAAASSAAFSPLLPTKSRRKYENAYERFMKWCSSKSIKNETNEKVLLAYFEFMSKKYKSSSLWAYYSMLRATMSMKSNVDISKYSHLVAFLKTQSKGYTPKKSKILTKDEVATFLREADDLKYLMSKVALIVGLVGACRKEELTNMLLENVKDEGHFYHFQIANARTKVPREFFITAGSIEGVNMVEIIRKYLQLRPPHTEHGRFFVGYKNGACVKQPVGINTFGSLPKNIASYLKLQNPEEYTGHCFRRSSSSVLAGTGGVALLPSKHK